MIKSLHKLLVARSEQDYRALVEFFDALGVARGESWEGRRSKGVKFDAREAGVEIGIGHGFPDCDLVIETDSADVAYEIATKRAFKIAGEISDTDWGARMFTLEMPAGAGRLTIFSYKEDWRAANTREGKLDATGLHFAIVVGRFNAFITERLLAGAQDALHRLGADAKNVTIVRVPGSFEIPAAARMLAKTGKHDAIICLGCLIRGETAHYEVIANEVTRGIGQSAQETGVPHAFGVLTCDTLEQAIDRAGLKSGNKGCDAALAAVEMAQLKTVDGRRSTVDGSRIKSLGSTARVMNSRSEKKRKQGRAKKNSTRHR
ncbi:MAG: 6,7-dimethyl-8-ribityllumazine synthase [Terriglobales bacterium]